MDFRCIIDDESVGLPQVPPSDTTNTSCRPAGADCASDDGARLFKVCVDVTSHNCEMVEDDVGTKCQRIQQEPLNGLCPRKRDP